MRCVLVLAAIVAGIYAGLADAAASGLRGAVMRGPTTPVCRAGVPCAAPAKNATLRFIRFRAVHLAKTDANGRYRISLAPGTYIVRIVGVRILKPSFAEVRAGRVSVANFTIDTGIR